LQSNIQFAVLCSVVTAVHFKKYRTTEGINVLNVNIDVCLMINLIKL
jgi:hypothetical protein